MTATLPTLVLPENFKLTVLMPVFNERATILEIVARVQSVPLPIEIVIVDDGSTDGTRDIIQSDLASKAGIKVVLHEKNKGKGAAVRTAIANATGTVCVIQDADLEYDPRDYHQLLEPILQGYADAVYGSRFVGGKPHRVHLYWHSVGNHLLTTLSNMMTNVNLTDMETCYKMVTTPMLQSLKLQSNGFEFEPELTAKLAKAHARFYEVPISYNGRDYAEGKKIGWRDGVKALYYIFRFKFGN